MRHCHQVTGRQLSAERVMAWHLRNALGDALWRGEVGIPLPDHRTPAAWVDDLSTRFTALSIHPEVPCHPQLSSIADGMGQDRPSRSDPILPLVSSAFRIYREKGSGVRQYLPQESSGVDNSTHTAPRVP